MTPPPRFPVGARVCVDSGPPRGHYRTPRYLFGCSGEIVAWHGRFRDPGKLAYHLAGLPRLHLYRVRFRIAELFADAAGSTDDLIVDLYEPWLRAADGDRPA